MLRRLVVFSLVFALTAGEFPAHAAGVSVVGVVTQATRANLASAIVTAGANVYDGDSLATASDGLLRVRSHAAQFYLAGQTSVRLHSAPAGTLVQLTGGTMVFSSANSSAMDVEVSQAHIRPAKDVATVAQISVVSPRIIQVRAKSGALLFSYNGESQLVPEGASFQFVLNPTDEELSAAAPPAFPNQKGAPPAGGRRKKGFLYIIIGSIAVATWIAVDEALESPDKP